MAFALKLHTLAVSGRLLATINGHRGSLVLIVDLHALRLTGFLVRVCVYVHVHMRTCVEQRVRSGQCSYDQRGM